MPSISNRFLVVAEIVFIILSPRMFFISKQTARHAVRNHDINQRIANCVIADNDVEKLHPSFADELFESEFSDEDDAVDDVVLVQSEQEILSKGFGDESESAHFVPRVVSREVGLALHGFGSS
jgi:hypothetical protein